MTASCLDYSIRFQLIAGYDEVAILASLRGCAKGLDFGYECKAKFELGFSAQIAQHAYE
jgi:hypothetical protein